MKISVELAQKQTLSHQLIQSMNILQMSAVELSEYIQNTAMENPVMELPDVSYSEENIREDDIQRKLDWLESTDQQNRIYYSQEKSEDYSGDLYSRVQSEDTLADYLKSQLLLSDHTPLEREIIDFIIDSLDSRGYLPEGPSFVADYFVIPIEKASALLEEVKQLDPAGVGAADLTECLLLQLYRKADYSPVTEEIIRHHLSDVARNHLHEIADRLDVSIDEVLDACEEIKSMNPKPSNSFSDRSQMTYIRPDAVVVKVKDYFEILINDYDFPRFTISPYYQELSTQTGDTETKQYLQQKLSQASWIQNCIRQRTETLSRVLKCIVERQQNFFLYGPGNRRPLKLSDIASELEMHESTVSRALKGKHLQCAHGIFPLNYFLTAVASAAASGNSSEDKTSEQIHEALRKIIDGEDKKKPLSDQAISDKLKEFDIQISRRTVNKYRTELGIPDKSGRKEWK